MLVATKDRGGFFTEQRPKICDGCKILDPNEHKCWQETPMFEGSNVRVHCQCEHCNETKRIE